MNQVLMWGVQLAKFRESGIAAEYRQGRGTTCRGLPEAEADEYPGPCSSYGRTLIMCQAQEAGTRQQALSNSRSLLVTAFTICSTQFSKRFLVFIITGYNSDHFIAFRILTYAQDSLKWRTSQGYHNTKLSHISCMLFSPLFEKNTLRGNLHPKEPELWAAENYSSFWRSSSSPVRHLGLTC